MLKKQHLFVLLLLWQNKDYQCLCQRRKYCSLNISSIIAIDLPDDQVLFTTRGKKYVCLFVVTFCPGKFYE